MNKVYPERINWEDEPSVATPLSATNLNKIDYATYEMDNRIITLDTSKANQSDLLQCMKSYTYDTETGVLTFTWQNGTTSSIDFNIEKIPVSFSMDANGVITMETDDGTTYTADVGALIKTYTFTDSTTVDFTVTTDASGNKTITAIIKDGSITADKIDPQYMASINLAVSQAEGYANSASGSATAASGSATTASNKALDSEAYAIGTRNGVPVTSEDPAYENNSKYYAEQAEQTDIGQVNNEIADIVNVYGAKNLIPYPYSDTTKTVSNVTFTDNGDGTITVDGSNDSSSTIWFLCSNIEMKAGISYLLTAFPQNASTSDVRTALTKISGGDVNTYEDFGNGIVVKLSNDGIYRFQIGIQKSRTVSNLTFKPMLRLSSISDNTYVPYVPTNAKLDEEKMSWKANGVLGAKNLIPYPYYQTTQTVVGITTTDNGDGTLTFNGTSTASSVVFRLTSNDTNIEIPLDKSKYIITWVESSKHNQYFRLDIGLKKSDNTTEVRNGKSGVIEINNTNGQYKGIFAISLYSDSGQTVSNLTFKPMLSLAEDTDDTYQPYAMTNYELTQKIAELQAQINALV